MAGRGFCPVCGDQFTVKADGRLRMHKAPGYGAGRGQCPGSNQAPVDTPPALPPRPRKPARPIPPEWRKKPTCRGRMIRYDSEAAARLRVALKESWRQKQRFTVTQIIECDECGGWHVKRGPSGPPGVDGDVSK